jgi:hypothetical protein
MSENRLSTFYLAGSNKHAQYRKMRLPINETREAMYEYVNVTMRRIRAATVAVIVSTTFVRNISHSKNN